jgi:hypothetical protein
MNAVLIQKVTNGYIMAPFNGQMIDFAKIIILPKLGEHDMETLRLVSDILTMLDPTAKSQSEVSQGITPLGVT